MSTRALTPEEVIQQLKTLNYVFSDLVMVNDSKYSVSDCEWNYKDSLHHNYVHDSYIEQISYFVNSDKYAAIWFVNLFLFKIPLFLLNYQATKDAQIAISPAFFFILVVENKWTALPNNGSRVTTTYNIGSPKIFYPVHFLMKFLLSRNYRKLMQHDLPLRERRHQLRNWGYQFKNEINGHYSYKAPEEILSNFIKEPPDISFAPFHFSIAELHNGQSYFTGESNHLGLRFYRSGDLVSVFPRICSHEGASLDKPKIENNCVSCPWHGRRFSPLGVFDVGETKIIHTAYHRIQVKNGQVFVSQSFNSPKINSDGDSISPASI